MGFDITVIFPYYNEEQSLGRTLELISQQTHAPKEVIFVNSSSTDGSSALIDRWIEQHQGNNSTKYRNVFEHTNTPSSSKNAGIRLAQTEWIAFMDCGLLFPEDWLELQVRYIKESGLDIVSGVCDFKGIDVFDNCCLAQTYGYQRKRPVVPSTLLRKSIFEKTGLFLENRRSGYDYVWQINLKDKGIVRGVNSDAVICYNGLSYADSFISLFKKTVEYLKPAVAIQNYYMPYLYVAIVFFLCISVFLSPMFTVGFFLVYILARWLAIPTIKSRGFSIFRDYPVAILYMLPIGMVMDFGRLIGIFQGIYFYHLGGNRKDEKEKLGNM